MALQRGGLTWYCYLLWGFFTFLLNIQGNVIPFLRDELALSYRVVSLHPSALAAGMVVTGLLADRVSARFGRRRTFWLSVAGPSLGAGLLCVAWAAPFSIAGCLLIGLGGALVPATCTAVLAERHPAAREQVFAEVSAITYAYAMLANLAVGACVALALGWRAAVLLGVALGIATVLALDPGEMAGPAAAGDRRRARLPPPYWACGVTLGLGVAIEYTVLLWSPAFLEQAAGMSRAGAASGAAVFSAAVLLGRLAGSRAVAVVPARALFLGTLVLILPGFALYWAGLGVAPSLAGLFVLGLGVAMLYPLTLGFLLEAAGAEREAGAARASVAGGLAILLAPPALGALADAVGLAAAHLVIPALVAAAAASFALAQLLQRREMQLA
jgi:predicted MFS family arabinose efflux permease